MAGTTTNLKLPYPTGTDKVVDGDNAIRALAERIDALNGTRLIYHAAYVSAVTSGTAIVQANIPQWMRDLGAIPVACVVGKCNPNNDTIALIVDALVWDRPPYTAAMTSIQIRVRRDDNNQWLGGNGVDVAYSIFAQLPATVVAALDAGDADALALAAAESIANAPEYVPTPATTDNVSMEVL